MLESSGRRNQITQERGGPSSKGLLSDTGIIACGEVSLPTTRCPVSPAVVSEWEGGTGYTSPHTAWSGALELPGSALLLCTLQGVGNKATALG